MAYAYAVPFTKTIWNATIFRYEPSMFGSMAIIQEEVFAVEGLAELGKGTAGRGMPKLIHEPPMNEPVGEGIGMVEAAPMYAPVDVGTKPEIVTVGKPTSRDWHSVGGWIGGILAQWYYGVNDCWKDSLAISLQTNTPLVYDTVAVSEHRARFSFEACPPLCPQYAANMLCSMPVRFGCLFGPVTMTGEQLWDHVPPALGRGSRQCNDRS